jgi:signal transduction histidine kinase
MTLPLIPVSSARSTVSLHLEPMTRLPIRLRLTLAFALVMALVLAAMGLILYLQLRSDLDRTVDQGLRSRAADVTALIKQADSGLGQAGRSPLTQGAEGFAQILDTQGHVVDSTPLVRNQPLLDRRQLSRAFAGSFTVDRGPLPGLDEPSRLLVVPVHAQGQRLAVVVGASLEVRNQAVANLRQLLLIGAPLALLLACLAGYGLATGVLRPVEAMRRQAAEISASAPGRRLPIAPSGDEMARLGRTLNEMLARLEVAFQRERTFVSNASHELRTPLAILKTELDLALRRRRSAGELERAIRSAAEETSRLTQLAEDLLVIARSDQGRLPVRLSETDLGDLLRGVKEHYEARAASQGRSIGVEDGGRLTILADRARIEQALANLMENTLRHGRGPIALSSRRNGERVEIHVIDQGDGFAPDFIDSAFERFTRGDPDRSSGGSGLGLAIVAAIAEAHEGSAHAANRAGGGADVWVELPL